MINSRPRLALQKKIKRFWILSSCLLCLGAATTLLLNAFSNNIVYFMTPAQLTHMSSSPHPIIRLGGMVVAGSLHKTSHNHTPDIFFDVTDGQASLTVHFQGILPDLFREGQSVVAIGRLTPAHCFDASEVLAKHDETYMPKEIADSLQKSGKWDPRFGPPPNASTWNRMIVPSMPSQGF